MGAVKSLWDSILDTIYNSQSVLNATQVSEQQRFALQNHQLMMAQKKVWTLLQEWPPLVEEPSAREIMLDAADRAAREEWSREWVYDAF